MRKKLHFILSLIVLPSVILMACKIFTPEYEEQLKREATETAQAPTAAPPANQAGEAPEKPVAPAPTLTDVPTLDLTCTWIFIDASEALATGGGSPGLTAERKDAWIGTRFTHAGNFGCEDQIFVTAHEWGNLDEELVPGKTITLWVTLTWRLEGTQECSSLTAGARTSLTVGTTTVEIGQSTINVSTEPNGDLGNNGSWTVPQGSGDGDTLTIAAHGSSGGLGGTVNYHYEYICSAP